MQEEAGWVLSGLREARVSSRAENLKSGVADGRWGGGVASRWPESLDKGEKITSDCKQIRNIPRRRPTQMFAAATDRQTFRFSEGRPTVTGAGRRRAVLVSHLSFPPLY